MEMRIGGRVAYARQNLPLAGNRLLELEQASIFARVISGLFLWEMRVGMAVVVVFGDVEAAPIHVKVDVALLVIGRDELPVRCLRVPGLDNLPGGVAQVLVLVPYATP